MRVVQMSLLSEDVWEKNMARNKSEPWQIECNMYSLVLPKISKYNASQFTNAKITLHISDDDAILSEMWTYCSL